MRHPNQQKTLERLEAQSHKNLRDLRNAGRKQVQVLWANAKHKMRMEIRDQYAADFRGEKWTMPLAARRKTIDRIEARVGAVLMKFHQESMSHAARSFRETYKQSVLRNAYMLDMVTPESYKVKLPKSRLFTEASAITTYTGPDADTGWKVRWSGWIDGYRSSLSTNLRLGAIAENSIDDAAKEVDVTKVNTPAYDLGTALDRIYVSQAVALQSQAQMELSDLNDEMDIEEIWQTSFSAVVCEQCDEQKGLTREQATDDIPAHPNCECYWRLVPASWAELLRNGDESEVDLAKWMDANGTVPGAMIIRGDDGEPAGKVIVTFDKWLQGNPQVVMSQ
jgi:hypothetical protein